MKRRMALLALALVHFGLVATPAAHAQDYPVRPLHIVLGYSAGGLGDTLARLVADKLQGRLGQPVIVDNKPGAGGVLAADFVARAVPDGYTLLQGTAAEMTYAASLPGTRVNYDSAKDFAPISMLNSSQMVLVAAPALGVRTVPELLQYARAHPTGLNYASFGIGSSSHLVAEMFKAATGVQVTHIPFKGSEGAVQELLAGRVQLLFNTVASSATYIEAGRLIPLAVTGGTRAVALPAVSTFAEVGLPGVNLNPWAGLFAPRGTPQPVVQRLSEEVNRVLEQPDVVTRLTALGAAPTPGTPEQLRLKVAEDSQAIRQLVRDSNIKFD